MTDRFAVSRRDFIGAGGALMAFAAGLSAPPARASAALFGATREKAAAAVKAILQQKDIPSVSYALFWRDGLVWADAAGIIDASGRPPGTDTLYCIGSCSKVVAVTAMMRLIEQGKAGLDDPLVKHVPGFRMLSPGYEAITLRMLMNHSSGLPGSEYRGAICTAWNGAYPDAVLATAGQARLKHRPGEMSVYCNDGFTLLELVIRAITGKDFVDVVQEQILTPLGMVTSRYGNREIPAGGFAPGINEGRMLPREVVNCAASGGLVTTPSELSRFLALFLNEGRSGGVEILTPASVAAMGSNETARQPFLPVAALDGYGLGWDSVNPAAFRSLGIKAWRKNGGTAVYSSDMIVLPERGLGVAVTGASTAFPAGMLSELILLAALAEQGSIPKMPEPIARVAGPASGQPVEQGWFDGVYGTYEQLFRFVADGKGGATQVKASAGAWNSHMEGLVARSDGSLASDGVPVASFTRRDYDGLTFLVAQAVTGYKSAAFEFPVAQKLKPLGEMSAAWKKRMGRSWVMVNAPADLFLPGMLSPVIRLDAYPEAPGYVAVGSDIVSGNASQPVDATQDDLRAMMCLKIPVAPGRDLNDLVILQRGGEEWLQYGSWVARPVEGIPALGRGARAETIGTEGYAAWFRLSETGWIDIEGGSDWMLLGDDFGLLASGKGGATGLGGVEAAYLLLYGSPGEVVKLRMA